MQTTQSISTVLVIGPRQVGKSEIINHLTNGSFNIEYYPNNGQDYPIKLARVQQTLSFSVTKIFEVQPIFWDGREMGLISYYAQISNIILIIVDITSDQNQEELINQLYCAANEKQNLDYIQQDFLDTKIAILGNLKGKHPRCLNKALTIWLSQFCVLNQIPLFEVDSCKPESLHPTFEHIINKDQKKEFALIQYSLNKLQRYLYPLQEATKFVKQLILFLYDDIRDFMEILS